MAYSEEKLIFEISAKGKIGFSLPLLDVPLKKPPKELAREKEMDLPHLSEVEIVRHYTRLSSWNYGVNTGFYPLGSCTMKYSPQINEVLSSLEGFSNCHPYQDEAFSQGALQIIYELGEFLKEICGLDDITLQPAAGAQGEFTGIKLISAFLKDQGQPRKKIIIPDTAHGTNPATATLCGYEIVNLKSNERGVIDIEGLAKVMDEETAGIMITNPNTLGLFEENIMKISELVHAKGGLIYCDGANLNALMGIVKVGDLGVDVIHVNLHKTFSTPHGGGGPGAGPILVRKKLSPYLPVPVVKKDSQRYFFDYNLPKSIGKVKAFYGNFSVLVKAYCYILSMGAEGLKKASELAVLNANYLKEKLKKYYHLPKDRTCMHECVFTDKWQNQFGIKTIDIAKRLLDYGFHPPTVYFPLVVSGALMIEPTETESKEELDRFIEAMIKIAEEAKTNPEILKSAPHTLKIKRANEVKAVRQLKLRA